MRINYLPNGQKNKPNKERIEIQKRKTIIIGFVISTVV